MAQTDDIFPNIDAQTQSCITDEQAQFFIDHGLLVIRNVLGAQESQHLGEQTLKLIQAAQQSHIDDPDYLYAPHELTGKEIPHRIEYVIDKTDAGKELLGHPFILRSVEKLLGPDFIPTWDSLVFKNEGMGKAVPWHRDGIDPHKLVGATPNLNVDFYLDGSDSTNCLWGIPGSNRWSPDQAHRKVAQLNQGGFHTDATCAALPMNSGDVIFHNVLTLHGSAPALSALRRTVYYEFRSIQTELTLGPHVPKYIPLK